MICINFCLSDLIKAYFSLQSFCSHSGRTLFLPSRNPIIITTLSFNAGIFIDIPCSHDGVVVNLGKSFIMSTQTENIRSTKTISNGRRNVYKYPCRQCYDLNSQGKILVRYGISIPKVVWRDVKLKTTRRNLNLRNMRTFGIKANYCRRKMKTAL